MPVIIGEFNKNLAVHEGWDTFGHWMNMRACIRRFYNKVDMGEYSASEHFHKQEVFRPGICA